MYATYYMASYLSRDHQFVYQTSQHVLPQLQGRVGAYHFDIGSNLKMSQGCDFYA